MEAECFSELIQEAFNKNGVPDISNTDQGSQFTSDTFTQTVLTAGALLSMNGKGRATDNAFIERLWRSAKYEKIYPHTSTNGLDLYQKLEQYILPQ